MQVPDLSSTVELFWLEPARQLLLIDHLSLAEQLSAKRILLVRFAELGPACRTHPGKARAGFKVRFRCSCGLGVSIRAPHNK